MLNLYKVLNVKEGGTLATTVLQSCKYLVGLCIITAPN